MSPNKFSYHAMGTLWEITVWDKISPKKFDQIKKLAIRETDEFDRTFSRFKKNSLVSQISKSKGIFNVPEDFTKMLSLFKSLYSLSGEVFTPLIGKTLAELGYDEEYSLKPKSKLTPVLPLEKTIKILDEKTIEVSHPALLDFGALGKGYFVQKLADLLKNWELEYFLVNGSGDIYFTGKKNLRVGLEHPDDAKKVIGLIELNNGSICASGINRRRWGQYNHIINPKTLKPAQEVIAVWVKSENASIADALATALFLCPPEKFIDDYKFEYLILNKDFKVNKSEGFNAELF